MKAGEYPSPGRAAWNGRTYTTIEKITAVPSTASCSTDMLLICSHASA